MPEDIYKQDRFYVDLQNDEIVWLYHNPDAFSGDQFVRNRFGIDFLISPDVKNRFSYISLQNLKLYSKADYIYELLSAKNH